MKRLFNDGHGLIWHFIDFCVTKWDERKRPRVKKKTFLLCMIGGVFGLHRFYAGQWVYGILYIAFCWIGWSAVMTMCDLIIYGPKKADEEGYIII